MSIQKSNGDQNFHRYVFRTNLTNLRQFMYIFFNMHGLYPKTKHRIHFASAILFPLIVILESNFLTFKTTKVVFLFCFLFF